MPSNTELPPAAANEYVTLSQAANALPHRPHPSSLWRWARRGVHVRARDGVGRVLRLPHIRLGGILLVRMDDVLEFGRRLAEADFAEDEPGAAEPQSEPHRSKRSEP